jgi:hypothetical protein
MKGSFILDCTGELSIKAVYENLMTTSIANFEFANLNNFEPGDDLENERYAKTVPTFGRNSMTLIFVMLAE